MAPTSHPAEWPAVEWDVRRWLPAAAGLATMSRRERTRQTGEYRSAVPVEIADLSYAPARQVSAAAEDAATEIARFDAEHGDVIAPFAAILLRSEAVASSQIENVAASAKAVALAELGDTSRVNARLIMANTAALEAASRMGDGVSATSILQMHAALMSEREPQYAGRWREQLVWIGRSSFGPVGADFVAPQAELIPGAIDDLIRYVARADLPVIEQIALAHAQFETIHPFVDGNGRTGRALMQAMLRTAGLVRNTTLPISSGLLGDVDGYHAALIAYQAGDADAIITRTAESAFRALDNSRRLVADVRTIRETWRSSVTARSDSAVWSVLDLLARRPVVNAAVLREELGISANHVARYLNVLVDAGVVTTMSGHSRGTHWKSDAMLDALDAFAARSGPGR